MRRHLALVTQHVTLFNDTVRNNILFHDAYDEKRYLEAIHACALKPDMTQFVDGDQTEVGEKGVTISGGQKQRVALARAAYSAADVVIFDDPLSAMDAHVGMTVFRRCFQKPVQMHNVADISIWRKMHDARDRFCYTAVA